MLSLASSYHTAQLLLPLCSALRVPLTAGSLPPSQWRTWFSLGHLPPGSGGALIWIAELFDNCYA